MMNEHSPKCAVIIVTYNSEKHIDKAMECLNQQTLPASQIILVDSGSQDPSYLDIYQQQPNVDIIIADKGIGFCKGNNIGMKKVPKNYDYVFFLNPDAFLTPSFLEKAITFMQDPENFHFGALTSTVLGYDIDKKEPKNSYDSTGIFRTWYGRWYDRYQGDSYQPHLHPITEHIPAICGAVLFCRKKALDSVLIRNEEVFDNTFYMYKEDIDLSLRLREKGWSLAFVPDLLAYHCRGWQPDRSKMPRKLRLCSVRNELRIQKRLLAPIPIAYSLLKYAAVKTLDL